MAIDETAAERLEQMEARVAQLEEERLQAIEQAQRATSAQDAIVDEQVEEIRTALAKAEARGDAHAVARLKGRWLNLLAN